MILARGCLEFELDWQEDDPSENLLSVWCRRWCLEALGWICCSCSCCSGLISASCVEAGGCEAGSCGGGEGEEQE